MDLTKFEALENKVTAMLNKQAALTRNNEELEENLAKTKNYLAKTQDDLDAAESLIKELQAEREAILIKVDTIIDRLE
ncbi:MAG: hypothetical protein AMR96_03255 [Candidatus Adiutrix intracellularis]|jgi:glutaredoxin 2|nr:MAG: hypothetical protein AMR96_03255 [Candidatus Adiutrix intracellularis]MDR2826780.1 hypothetical protein [Candidatus Adiutrix intracellularis]